MQSRPDRPRAVSASARRAPARRRRPLPPRAPGCGAGAFALARGCGRARGAPAKAPPSPRRPPLPRRFVRCGLLLARAACGHCRDDSEEGPEREPGEKLGREREDPVARRVDEAELVAAADLACRRDPDGEGDDEEGQRGVCAGENGDAGSGRVGEPLEVRKALRSCKEHRDRGEGEDRSAERPEIPEGDCGPLRCREGFQIEGEASSQRPERLGARGKRYDCSARQEQVAACPGRSHAERIPRGL